MALLSTDRQATAFASRARSRVSVPIAALLTDLSLATLAALAAVLGRQRTLLFPQGSDVTSTLEVVGPLTILGWLLLIYLVGGYRRDLFGAGPEEFKKIVNASLLTAGLLGVGCYLTKFPLSRGFFFLLFIVGVPALLLGRMALRRTLHVARRRGALGQRVLIAGGPAHVDEIARVLRRESWLGYRVIGALTPATNTEEETPAGVPVVGNLDDVSAMTADDVDAVFFAGGAHTSGNELRKTVWQLEKHDVHVVVAPSVSEISSDRIQVRPVAGLPLMHIEPPTWSQAVRIGKRTFDLLGSVSLLVALSPLFLFAACWIKIHDGGPVLFRQRRVGRDGAEFDCLKFRSMVPEAETLLDALHVQHGYDEGLFKLKDDPRVTRPGRWLRRYSMDELPQLVNVLRGEMSLVGPRPPLPLEVRGYDADVERRLHVRPGMTGLWQVSGRADLSWEDAVRLDLYYVDNWSMLQDLNILLKTFGAVVSNRGAY